MHTLNPGMVLSPNVDHGLFCRITPLVKESNDTISESSNVDIAIRLVGADGGQIGSSLSRHVLYCSQRLDFYILPPDLL